MLKQLKYFQAVVRLGSFSEAAVECYISQSAISQQVQSLERKLGVKLLKRENRRFSLTPAGEHFYRQSLLLVADYERLCKETVQIDHGKDFTLHIGYLKNYSGLEFQKAVAEFTEKYPEIPVEMKAGNHEDLYKLLKTDKIDLVLNDQRRAFSDEYINIILSTEASCIEISARSPIAGLKYVNVNDLRHTPCILITSKEQRENEQNYYREIYGITSDIIFADNLDEARLMVIGGKGYLPIEGGSLPSTYSETIVRLSLCRNNAPIHRNYCMFWKAGNSSFYIEEFAEILKTQFINVNTE